MDEWNGKGQILTKGENVIHCGDSGTCLSVFKTGQEDGLKESRRMGGRNANLTAWASVSVYVSASSGWYCQQGRRG